jgi:succinyl-CoA synthetase beta subunit
MNTHEYQAKDVMRGYGLHIPEFGVASNKKEAEKFVLAHKLTEAAVKIQVHAGGRGKAGGVKIAKTPEEIIKAAHDLIGMKMVNKQTGPEGVVAHKVIISKLIEIKKEFYLGAVIDRVKGEPIIIASPEGGMEIEEIAEKKPDKILKFAIDLDGTIKPYHLVELAKFMGWTGKQAEEGSKMAMAVAKAFIEKDADLLEINPLVSDPHDHLWAVDVKLSIDDNALFRQPAMAALYDPSQLPKNEVEAKKYDLAFISLDGNIGCMVNGAGLAMATMDLIKTAGGKPANFLDVGGGATAEKIAAGFRILTHDPHVKAILVNIFGGIMNCATIAEGIIAAAQDLKVPLIVRMEGTNVDMGREMLKKSGLKIESAMSLREAAEKVVGVL